MTSNNSVRIVLGGFKCESCGGTAAVTSGAIMCEYMRELVNFEKTHKDCVRSEVVAITKELYVSSSSSGN